MFDLVVVIEHPRRPERMADFWAGLPADWPFVRPVPFMGVDGVRCRAPTWWRGSAASWGATTAHHRAIEWAITSGASSLLVLEDDAVFSQDFTRAAQAVLADLPQDAAMIYLGGHHLAEPHEVGRDHVVGCLNTNCAHAYGLVGDGIERIYEWLHAGDHWKRPHVVDHHYGRLHESGHVPCYAARRWLVGQRAGFSDTDQAEVPERWWHNYRSC